MVKNKKCFNCGKELTNQKQKKFCSRSCSASYNNRQRVLSRETRDKISKTLSQKNINFDENEWKNRRQNNEEQEKHGKCINCGKILLSKNIGKFCSHKCQHEYKYKAYITKWKLGEVNGMRGKYSISEYIKHYLFEKHDNKCQICGWNKRNPYTNRIPLEIHHVDGDYRNNQENNLQLLCPNCHSLTETYKAHNKNGRKERSKYNNNIVGDERFSFSKEQFDSAIGYLKRWYS